MDVSKQKEQFSKAYVTAIAAQVGLNNVHLEVDDDSVDLALRGRNFTGKIRNPQLDLQLKCTSRDLIKDGELRFPLSIKNYNDLRGDDVICPRYLFILVVPDDVHQWAELRNDELVLKNTCYWASIRSFPETKNETSVTVSVPTSQVLTKDSLLSLMKKASEGVYL